MCRLGCALRFSPVSYHFDMHCARFVVGQHLRQMKQGSFQALPSRSFVWHRPGWTPSFWNPPSQCRRLAAAWLHSRAVWNVSERRLGRFSTPCFFGMGQRVCVCWKLLEKPLPGRGGMLEMLGCWRDAGSCEGTSDAGDADDADDAIFPRMLQC